MALSLGDTANWESFFVKQYARNYTLPVTSSDYGMIGEQIVPVLLTSPYIVVAATTATGKPNWKQAGYCKQMIRTVDGSVDTFINQRLLLSLNQPTLLSFNPALASSYAFWFRPFDWFNDLTIEIYQYTGSLT